MSESDLRATTARQACSESSSCWTRNGPSCVLSHSRHSRPVGCNRRRPIRCHRFASIETATRCRRSTPIEQITVVATVDEVRLVFGDQLDCSALSAIGGKSSSSSIRCTIWRLLERKPGGFDHARPLEDWELPVCFGILRGAWKRNWAGWGHGSSSRCCGCWSDTRSPL